MSEQVYWPVLFGVYKIGLQKKVTNIHYGWLKEVIYCTKVFKIIYMFPFKSDQFSRNFKA